MGIANRTADDMDLLRPATQGRSRIRVTAEIPIAGRSQLDTATSIVTVFALAEHASVALSKPVEIVFDAFDNAPAETVHMGGDAYSRSFADLVRAGQLDRTELFAGLDRLLEHASTRSGVPYTAGLRRVW